jgi:hypothetical protein
MNCCPVCKIWTSGLSHKCPPKWYARLEEGYEWQAVYAYDSEEAAEKFAEEADSDSGMEASNGGRHEFNVEITPIDVEGYVYIFHFEVFTIYPEPVIEYRAFPK